MNRKYFYKLYVDKKYDFRARAPRWYCVEGSYFFEHILNEAREKSDPWKIIRVANDDSTITIARSHKG